MSLSLSLLQSLVSRTIYVRSEDLMLVNMEITNLYDLTPCSLVYTDISV
jgi:hypothetical protein